MTTLAPAPGRPGAGVDSAATAGPARRGAPSAFFFRHRWTQTVLLLTAPMFWLVVAYLGSIAILLVSAFWRIDEFTGNVIHSYSTANFSTVATDSVIRTVTLRTVSAALLVTVIDAVLAFPMAFFMSAVAGPRLRRVLVVAVLTPLWASYLVKAYAWRSLLAPNGPLSYLTGGAAAGYGFTATVVTLSYLWFPYMVLPIFAGFERLPRSLLEASADLGARTWRTTRAVLLPLVFPAIAAGSIFTFSLTLGDYIAVGIVGGKTQFLGNLIYGQLITANNQPLAAALSVVPLVAVVLHLIAIGRTGALENV